MKKRVFAMVDITLKHFSMVSMFFVLLTIGLGLYIYFKNKDDAEPASSVGVRAVQPKTGAPPGALPIKCDKGKVIIDRSGRNEHALELSCAAFRGQKLYINSGVPAEAFETELYKKLAKCNATPDRINNMVANATEAITRFLKRKKNLIKARKMVRTIIEQGTRTPQAVREKEVARLVAYITKKVRPVKKMIQAFVAIQKCFLPTCNDCAYAHLLTSAKFSIIRTSFLAISIHGNGSSDGPSARGIFDDGDSSDEEPHDEFSFGGLFGTMSQTALEAAMSVDASKV